MNTVSEFLLDSNTFPELNEYMTKNEILYGDTKSLQHS